MKSFVAAVFLAASVFSAACAGARGRVYVRTGPPPVRREAVLVSPGPGYVWIPGYYSYAGNGYAWVPGRYERAPRARARWTPAHWERDRRGWFFVEGRWR